MLQASPVQDTLPDQRAIPVNLAPGEKITIFEKTN